MERAIGQSFLDRVALFELKPAPTKAVWPAALISAWSFDFLFWGKVPGISFPIFVAIVVASGYAVIKSASMQIPTPSKLLLIPLAVFSVTTALRAEPFTMFLNIVLSLGLLGLLADSIAGRDWLRYRLTDYIVAFIHLAFAGIVGGATAIFERRSRPEAKGLSKRSEAILRGVLLSVPILLLFGLLFASADLVFSELITSPLAFLESPDLSEFGVRAFLVLIFAVVLAGIFLYSIQPRKQEDRTQPSLEKASDRGLGFIEGSIILGSLNLLFALFVGIQFRYFFGGSAAIERVGLTYSEYARRGFSELVFVAVITLALLVGLGLVITKEDVRHHRIFSFLSSGLVVLTGIILLSAFQRLFLYEDAYGFTRLRTYSHVLMVWIGITLIAVLVLQWKESLRSVALVIVLAALGFTASLNVLGVDRFIAAANIDRAIRGAEFDVSYLRELSSDAVPVMVARVDELSGQNRRDLSLMLSCKALENGRVRDRPWQSIHATHERAHLALRRYHDNLDRAGTAPNCGRMAVPQMERLIRD